jgi:predicted SAM-dependent methyltransferase
MTDMDMTLYHEKQHVNEKELITNLRRDIDRNVPGSGIAKIIGRMVPPSMRTRARIIATAIIRPQQRLVAAKLSSRSPLQLNIGCGTLPLDGWINIDLIGLPVDLRWDIHSTLPFKENTVDAIFHEHVMEHIDACHGYFFVKDCYRVLKPGGVLRIVMPDASKYIRSYIDPEHQFINSWRPGRPTPMMALQEEFYGFSHRAIYDFDTVELFCKVAGFSEIESKTFGDSRLSPCPDSEWRITDSFYTEAVK